MMADAANYNNATWMTDFMTNAVPTAANSASGNEWDFGSTSTSQICYGTVSTRALMEKMIFGDNILYKHEAEGAPIKQHVVSSPESQPVRSQKKVREAVPSAEGSTHHEESAALLKAAPSVEERTLDHAISHEESNTLLKAISKWHGEQKENPTSVSVDSPKPAASTETGHKALTFVALSLLVCGAGVAIYFWAFRDASSRAVDA
jgi:hypothetical protein